MPLRLSTFPLPDLHWHSEQARKMPEGQLRALTQRCLGRTDPRAALIYLEALYQHRPTAILALQLAAMHRQCQSFALGLVLLQQADQRWPGRRDILLAQAELAMLAQDFALAGPLWQRLLEEMDRITAYHALRALGCARQLRDEPTACRIFSQHEDILATQYPPAALARLRHAWPGRDLLAPGLYMLTGNNGTGKTTIGHVLQALGLPIIDADVEIGAFCLGHDWAVVGHELCRHHPNARTRIEWLWPRIRFEEACARHRVSERPVFLIGGCGKAVAPFVQRARMVFHLFAPTQVIAQRLVRRGSPAHRKGSEGYREVLRRNAKEAHPDYDAQIIPANRPVWESCAEILESIDSEAWSRKDCSALH